MIYAWDTHSFGLNDSCLVFVYAQMNAYGP